MGKRGMIIPPLLFQIVLILVVLWGAINFIPGFKPTSQVGLQATGAEGAQAELITYDTSCQIETTSINPSPQDVEAKGATVDLASYLVMEEDGNLMLVPGSVNKDQSTDWTEGPGSERGFIAGLYSNITTSATLDETGDTSLKAAGSANGYYYSLIAPSTIPCNRAMSANIYAYAIDTASYAATTGITVTAYDENDQVNSADGTNDWAIGTGVYTGKLKVKVSDNYYWNNPECGRGDNGMEKSPVMICMSPKQNGARFDKIEVVRYTIATGSSINVVAAAVPGYLKTQAQTSCYKLMDLPFIGPNDETVISVNIDGGSTEPANGDDLYVYFPDADYFVHTETGVIHCGYEDNDNNEIGADGSTTADKTVYLT